MVIRAIAIFLAVMLVSSCGSGQDQYYTTSGPTLGPDKELLVNIITFNYGVEDAEPVHILVDDMKIETIEIKGEGSWKIELVDGKLIGTSSGGTRLFEVPVAEEGILGSELLANGSTQAVFDLSVGGTKVATIQCAEVADE